MIPLESQQEYSKGRTLSAGQLGWSLLQVGVVKKRDHTRFQRLKGRKATRLNMCSETEC